MLLASLSLAWDLRTRGKPGFREAYFDIRGSYARDKTDSD